MPYSPGTVLISLKDHWIMSGPKTGKHHSVMVTYGCSQDAQKRPIYKQMSINEIYFDGKPNIELWVDAKLVGLCAIEVSRDDPEDVEPEHAHLGVYYHVSLHAVIIRKTKRKMGFSDYLSTAAAELMSNQILDFMSLDSVNACTVIFTADLVSAEGETFYFDMVDKAENNFSACGKILGRKVEMSLEAWF